MILNHGNRQIHLWDDIFCEILFQGLHQGRNHKVGIQVVKVGPISVVQNQQTQDHYHHNLCLLQTGSAIQTSTILCYQLYQENYLTRDMNLME